MKKLFQEGGSQARNWWLSSGIIFREIVEKEIIFALRVKY